MGKFVVFVLFTCSLLPLKEITIFWIPAIWAYCSKSLFINSFVFFTQTKFKSTEEFQKNERMHLRSTNAYKGKKSGSKSWKVFTNSFIKKRSNSNYFLTLQK